MEKEISESTVHDGGQFLTFRLEQELYSVPIETVLEVLDFQPVTKIPGSKDILKGVINLRGEVVPVTDIRIKFGMTATAKTKNTCIIVVTVKASADTDQTTVGVLADQVMEVAEIDASDIQQAPDMGTGIPAQYLRGIGKRGNEFFMMLDVDAIISDDIHTFTTALAVQ